jgi:hypothetical protein
VENVIVSIENEVGRLAGMLDIHMKSQAAQFQQLGAQIEESSSRLESAITDVSHRVRTLEDDKLSNASERRGIKSGMIAGAGAAGLAGGAATTKFIDWLRGVL